MSANTESRTNFTPLETLDRLEQLFTLSHNQPVILFKHSLTCPISGAAYQRLTQLDDAIALVIVQTARQISDAIESQTGVLHESPQALVLRNGCVAWHASHRQVTAESVTAALREHQ